MGRYRIEGGHRLEGRVRVQGSKNAVLPMMAASLLQKGTVILRHCPRIDDVRCMEEILRYTGARTWWQKGDLFLDCRDIVTGKIPGAYADKMRSSVFLLGGLLPRLGSAFVSYPGGCTIGQRPVDLHLSVLRALGAKLTETEEGISASAGRLRGCSHHFPKISVGATENGVLAAVLAEGETCLYNCAREPEILHLCRFLRRMGAVIQGEESGTIRIRGVSGLHSAEMEVPADRIAAGTYLLAGAAPRGEVALEGAPVAEIRSLLELYGKMGGQYEVKGGTLFTDSRGIGNRPVQVATGCYPGFPTDLQSPLAAVCATIEGISRIRETIFEDRYQAALELRKMGADISVRDGELQICGGRLRGAALRAGDLRGGAALILAGLAASGVTQIENSCYVERGYEQIEKDLRQLGGAVRYEKTSRLPVYADTEE